MILFRKQNLAMRFCFLYYLTVLPTIETFKKIFRIYKKGIMASVRTFTALTFEIALTFAVAIICTYFVSSHIRFD